MSDDFEATEETNLIEFMADFFGFSKLSAALPARDIYPPYLFVGFFSFLDLAVLQVYVHFNGGTHVLIDSPNVVAGYAAVLLGVYGVRYMSNGYEDALSAARIRNRIDRSEVDRFRQTVSRRTKVIIYVTAVVVLYANTVLNVGIPNRVTAINFLFTWEFVFLPVIVEFALTYYGIHFRLPRQIRKADLNMFFYDPRNMGGFAAVGQLLKRSYYLYTVGLLLFFFLVYGAVFLPSDGYVPGVFELVFFSTAWFVGLLSIGHSMYSIHQFMSDEKEERIRELEGELHAALENPYDINNSRIADQEQLEDARRRLEQVRNTRVYPATFTMWSQIAVSVLLPQLLQLAVQSAL
ncbi:hypothetical protein [Halosimplex marinum]|uniref:hypothetical protein n=1 Tax=Halosimplex marinum TaxID=3396620 RepID=UPI003F574266